MNTLADLALTYLRTFMFSIEGDGIDPDMASKAMQVFPEYIAALTDEEKQALSAAAQRELDRANEYLDEFGYSPQLFTDEEKAFLEILATGDLYTQWK